MSAGIECRGLCAGFDGIAVVHELDLTVAPGEVVALLGANGAGKTTTLSTIAGLVAPIAGSLTIAGASTSGGGSVTRRTLDRVARGVALVPEDRALFASLTTREHLRLATSDAGARAAALEPFPALRQVLDRPAGVLSGGEQQMLALARALASRPRVLLIDEMSLGLAPIVVEQLLPAVRDIATTTGAAVLLVEQQVPAALAISDRAYVLSRGRIVASGAAGDLAADPERLRASYLGGP